MIFEISSLTIDPAKAAGFLKMYNDVAPVLRKQPGYINDKLLMTDEIPGNYYLIVEWKEKKDHQNFIQSADYSKMAAPFGIFVLKSNFEHYSVVAKS